MVRIILDTNFLLLPGEFHLDIFSEIRRVVSSSYQLCIIDKTKEEIENLIRDGSAKQRAAAKLAKKLLTTYPIKTIATDGTKHVDLLILENLDKDTIVATMDQDLRRRLRARGISHLVMRGKNHLELLGV